MIEEEFLDHIMKCQLEVICLFQHIRRLTERLRDDGVQHNIRPRDRRRRADHTELKLVSGKCERRRTVAVCRIGCEVRKRVDTGLHDSSLLGTGRLTGAAELVNDILELLAQEHGDYRRRSLRGTQSPVVARNSGGLTEKIGMAVDRFQDTAENQKKLHVFMRSLSRINEIDSVIGETSCCAYRNR